MASKAIGFLNFKFSADLTSFERAMRKAQKNLKKFGKNVTKAGQNLSRNLTLPIVALGGAALKTFADFEQGMLKVKAVSGATTSEFKALTESAKQLGSETMFSASQVAELQFELSKLGLDPTAILNSTQAILQLAQATDTELGEAAKTTAVALNSYNLEADEASRLSDIMALASSSAAMDMEKFGAALPKVAATARISGDSFELMSAKLQVLADSGMEGSRMGTQLKIIYSKLVSAGLTWDEAMGKLQKSTNKISTAQKIFGENAFNAAIILSENTEKLNEYEDANLKAIGTSKKMAEIMDSGVGGAFRKLRSQLEGASIELGEKLVPIFTKVAEKIKSLIKLFTDLDSEQQKNIVKWGLIVAAIGPVLIIIGKISIGIAALMPLLTTLGKVMLRHPLITAFTLASVGIYKMVKAWKSLKEVESAESILAKRRLELQKQVNAETKLEIDQINEKVGIARDAEASDKDRMSAVKFLNTEIKGLNGQLTLENINTKSTTDSINKHTEAIIANAKAAGAKKQLEQAVMDLEEAERLYSVAFKFHMKNAKLAGKDFMGQVDYAEKMISPSKQKDIDEAQKVVDALVAMIKEVEKVGAELNAPRTFDEIMITKYANSINGLNEKMSDLQFVMNDATKGSEDYNKAAKEIVNTQKELDKMYSATTSTVVGSGEEYSRALDPLLAQIKDYAATMTVLGASMYLVETWTLKLTKAQEAHNATIQLMEDIMFSAAMSAADSQQKFFDSFIENIKKAIKQLLIQLAVLTVIALLLGGGTVTIGQAFGIAKNKMLGLEDGGLVYGPTTALIGEGVGTTASNPEVVAPLDKLKQHMGGGNQNIIVEGVLKGNDIYLSNKNTSVNRLRTT